MSGWIIDEGYWYTPNSPITNVNVSENIRRYTGLLDSSGRAIYREPNEVGFGRRLNIYSAEY